MTLAFFAALQETIVALDVRGITRVLVISSSGKHFSAGMSLEVFDAGQPSMPVVTARDRLGFQRSLAKLMASLTALEQARFPVICAIQGGCIGGALDLATACDLRLCTRDAFFVVQETAIGMAADLGVLQRLQKVVPAGIAREMAYTGERLQADRAVSAGLVNEVLEDVRLLMERALALARSIAAKSPLAIAGTKAALNYARDHSTEASLAQMALLQSAIYDPAEIDAAIRAWKSKQPTNFDPLAAAQ